MAEYIEREALVAALSKETSKTDDTYGMRLMDGLDRALRIVRKLPAADVVEREHGKWLPCESGSDVRFFCDKCETEISTSWDYDQEEMWNFCPRCGARMDGAI